MAKLGARLGKLSLKILEHFVGTTLGEEFVGELRKPTDRELAIESALENSEKRFVKEFSDKAFAANIFAEVGDEGLGLISDAIEKFYDHPTDPDFQGVLNKIITESFPANDSTHIASAGDVQQFRKENDAALESYNEALKLFRQVGDKLGEANVLSALCRMSVKEGDIESAEKQLSAIIQTRRLIGDLYSEGADYGNFSIALLANGYKEKAKEYAQRARPIFEKINLPAIVEMMDQIIVACDEKSEEDG